MRISDWSSDVCSSDLNDVIRSAIEGSKQRIPLGIRSSPTDEFQPVHGRNLPARAVHRAIPAVPENRRRGFPLDHVAHGPDTQRAGQRTSRPGADCDGRAAHRSEEHTSELPSLMRSSYAVFCLKKKNKPPQETSR